MILSTSDLIIREQPDPTDVKRYRQLLRDGQVPPPIKVWSTTLTPPPAHRAGFCSTGITASPPSAPRVIDTSRPKW